MLWYSSSPACWVGVLANGCQCHGAVLPVRHVVHPCGGNPGPSCLHTCSTMWHTHSIYYTMPYRISQRQGTRRWYPSRCACMLHSTANTHVAPGSAAIPERSRLLHTKQCLLIRHSPQNMAHINAPDHLLCRTSGLQLHQVSPRRSAYSKPAGHLPF